MPKVALEKRLRPVLQPRPKPFNFFKRTAVMDALSAEFAADTLNVGSKLGSKDDNAFEPAEQIGLGPTVVSPAAKSARHAKPLPYHRQGRSKRLPATRTVCFGSRCPWQTFSEA